MFHYMHTMRRSYSLCLLALFTLVVFGASSKAAFAEIGGVVELTAEERAWLVKHPSIKLGASTTLQPLVIQDAKGKISGILPEIFAQLEVLTGLNISIEVGLWPETIKRARQGEIDGLGICAPALAKANGLSWTKEYITTFPVVFGNSDAPFKINSLDDLRGKRVAYLRGTKFMEDILAPLGGGLAEDTPIRLLDDGSADGTREAVARDFPSVELVRLPFDGGFAGAHNRGLRRAFAAHDDAVLLLSLIHI